MREGSGNAGFTLRSEEGLEVIQHLVLVFFGGLVIEKSRTSQPLARVILWVNYTHPGVMVFASAF